MFPTIANVLDQAAAGHGLAQLYLGLLKGQFYLEGVTAPTARQLGAAHAGAIAGVAVGPHLEVGTPPVLLQAAPGGGVIVDFAAPKCTEVAASAPLTSRDLDRAMDLVDQQLARQDVSPMYGPAGPSSWVAQ